MRRLALLLFLCAPGFAQVYEAKDCVYRVGDDLRWAQPGYDDSGWAKWSPASDGSRQPGPRVWMRCRIDVPEPEQAPLFVQDVNGSARQVFMNGIEAGSFGDMESGRHMLNYIQSWKLPTAAHGPSVVVATRMVAAPRIRNAGKPAIGSRSLLEARSSRLREGRFRANSVFLMACPVFLAIGLLLIVIAWGDTRRETLYLGLALLGRGLAHTASILHLLQAQLPAELLVFLNVAGNLGGLFHAFFFYSLRDRPVPRFFRICAGVAGAIHLAQLSLTIPSPDVSFRMDGLLWHGFVRVILDTSTMLLQTAFLAAFLPVRSLLRRDLPLLALTAIYFTAQEVSYSAQIPGFADVTLLGWGRTFEAASLLPLALSFTVLLTVRMRRAAERQTALERDMDAARELQRRLVPEQVEPVAGFHIEAAYAPAKEVGGDFYQFLPGEDGSLLVVVGDVSGKGLDAAMIVSTVVGALKNEDSREPAQVLARLNRVVGAGGRGFVTCSCALFRAGGVIEIASAGHIAPYVAGRELDMVPGPPLGILADVAYEAVTIPLSGGAITFFSDGVVEATNARGELLGFERLAGLSVKPALEIAKEAERWGQEDDITVVQVAYA